MTWVRLDDSFSRHPKARAAGVHGRSLFVTGLCYCAGQLTDGRIPKTEIPMLAAEAEVKPTVARRLVDVGLWEDHGDHYLVHDYLIYNESREKVLTRREAGRRRQERSRRSRHAVTGSATDTDGHGGASRDPSSPRPSTSTSPPPPTLVAANPTSDADRTATFEAALRLLAQRKLASSRTRPVNAVAWLATVVDNDRRDLAAQAGQLLAEYPTLTAAELADVFQGQTRVLRDKPRSPAARGDCPDCIGSGVGTPGEWHEADCPKLDPGRATA